MTHPILLAPDSNSQQTKWRFWLVVVLVLLFFITLGHYGTDTHAVAFHNVYRRLYYVPIVLGAFGLGRWGGLAVAVAASLVYLPHAFWMDHGDPAPMVDKWLEILLYLFIGELTGRLVHRQAVVQAELQRSLAERDTLERQLIRAGKLGALGHMTAGLAHEIRNPLASIQGGAEALVAELTPEHRKYRIGQLLLKEIDRLDRVVGEFLKFGRPATPERRSIDLYDVVTRVVEFVTPDDGEPQVAPEVTMKPGEFVVFADFDQLQQVVLNLYLNARQAVQRRGEEGDPRRRPRITVGWERRQVAGRAYLCLGVADNGPGIADDLLEEVFNPYFTTRADGTGLGLSISSRIVEAHDGFLDIDSRPGHTTVWLCLPQENS